MTTECHCSRPPTGPVSSLSAHQRASFEKCSSRLASLSEPPMCGPQCYGAHGSGVRKRDIQNTPGQKPGVFRVSALLVSVAVVVTGVLVHFGGLVDHRGLGGARCKPFQSM